MPSAGRGAPPVTDSQPGDHPEPAPSHDTGSGAELYGRSYYSTYFGGPPYERSDHWLSFFGRIAEQLVTDIAPRTFLDAGCAMGFLVEAMRDRGVDAEGVDISDYAISQAREDIRPHLRVGSVLERFGRRYDLISCIETLEHIDAGDAERAVGNLCAHTDDIIFTSTPSDHEEPTHVNVRPPEYWIELFLRLGFVHDIEYDHRVANLAPWGMRFRRKRDPLERQIVACERELWRLRDEKQVRDRLIVERTQAAAQHLHAAEELIARRDSDQKEALHLGAELADAEAQVAELMKRADEARLEAQALRAEMERQLSTVTYRLANGLRQSATPVFPERTRRGRFARRAVRRVLLAADRSAATALPAEAPETSYPLGEADRRWNQWLAANSPSAEDLRRMREESRSWTTRPRVSILMPAYESEEWYLRAAIESLREQAYENWELCIADDASTSPSVHDTVARYAGDERIRLGRRTTNGGIAAASQSAAEIATGELIALIDHDDVLQPHALYEMVRHVTAHPDDEIVYSDEDKLDPWGRRVEAHLKPDWSPELLDSCNYISHFTMMRRELFDRVGGFRPGFDGSQDYDLVLRATEKARAVGHVAQVLYSWRMAPRSTALSADAKPQAYEAACRALVSAFERRGEVVRVDHGFSAGLYDVRRHVDGDPTIAVVIVACDGAKRLAACIESVAEQAVGRRVRIVVVDNDTLDAQDRVYVESAGHALVHVGAPYNLSRMANAGVAAAGPVDHVLLLDADVMLTSPTSLSGLLEQSQREPVGAVGGRVLTADGCVEHEGIRIGAADAVAAALDLSDYFGMGRVTRPVSAVSAACLMVKRSLWERLGGFEVDLRTAYGDVDFCLRLRDGGYRNVYTALAEVRLQRRRTSVLPPLEDERVLRARRSAPGSLHDPYIGPHLRSVRPRIYE
jgi:GT2 family glycosyltransferase